MNAPMKHRWPIFGVLLFPLLTAPHLLDPGKAPDKLHGGGKVIVNVYVIDQEGVLCWQRVGTMDLAGADVTPSELNKLLADGSSKV